MASFLETIFGAGQRFVSAVQAQIGQAPGPETRSADAECMHEQWQLIADVMEGSTAIKRGGEKYLPKFEKKSAKKYRRRLADAPWRPIFASAVEGLTSRPFAKPITLAGTVSKRMNLYGNENVDGCGNNISVFSRRIFDAGVTYGLAAIFVDFSRVIPRADGVPLTVADEREQNLRPYWIEVRAQDLIDVKTDFLGGREVVTHARWFECGVVRDGFGEKQVDRIRAVELDAAGKPHWALWEKQPGGGYEQIASGDMSIPEIPLVRFFTGRRKGTIAVKPPLYDLAIVALEHYRAMARTTEIENFSGWPCLVGVGMSKPAAGKERDPLTGESSEAPVMELGPGITLFAPPAGAEGKTDWKIIGPDAALVAEVAKIPERVLEHFNKLAMEPAIPRSNVTATATAIDNSRAHSALEAWAGALKDALDQALRLTAMWVNEPDAVTAVVSTDFVSQIANTDEAKVLADAQKRGVVSGETERSELKRRGILSPDWIEEEELARLAFEQEGLEGETLIDPVTGAVLIKPMTTNAQTANQIAKQAQDETRQRMQDFAANANPQNPRTFGDGNRESRPRTDRAEAHRDRREGQPSSIETQLQHQLGRKL